MEKKAQWALVGAAWFLALSVAGFGVLAWRHMAPSAPAAPGATAWDLQADGMAVCPVTGKRIKVEPDTSKVNYQGHVYYFAPDKDADGQDARTRFLMDPEGWLKRQAPAP